MDIRTCIEVSFQAVTYGQRYEVFGVNPRNPHQIRIKNDRGHNVWISASCFVEGAIVVPIIHEVIIRDDLTDQKHAIEVEVILASGERRWCWFATPPA